METSIRIVKPVTTVVAIAMSSYHLYTGATGSPEALMHRTIHLLFALSLIFLIGITSEKKPTKKKIYIDLFIIACIFASLGHLLVNYEYVSTRYPYVVPLSNWDLVMGILLTVIVLEASRRTLGLTLPITAIAFLVYAILGKYFPGPIQHGGLSFEIIVDQLYLTTEGIFGIPLGVSATYVILFIIFGAFLEKSGTGQFFSDFANALVGGTRGGPAKISCVSSALFGTISGSAVANVMVDGWLTIPLMKRAGFKGDFAAAVEATASTGGQIMPPVMGAAAFVMAEYTGVSYIQICKHALIPALLFYLALFMAVHFEAYRKGIAGVPKDERPEFRRVLAKSGHLFLPLGVIIYFMAAGYTPMYACIFSTLSVVIISFFRTATRMGLKSILAALEDGARNTLSVAAACACAGIIIGILNLTGLSLKFTSLILAISGNQLVPALICTMFAGIVLGMGMPTTAAYIVQAVLLIPALIKLGVPMIAAHLFVFYFAIISAITPPVAMAVYAAAGISGSNLWQTGLQAIRIGATGFIVPFMFVYGPSLLLIGSFGDILLTIVSASIGVTLLSAGMVGWLIRETTYAERIVLILAAILLIKPGIYTDIAGLVLAVSVFIVQKLRREVSPSSA